MRCDGSHEGIIHLKLVVPFLFARGAKEGAENIKIGKVLGDHPVVSEITDALLGLLNLVLLTGKAASLAIAATCLYLGLIAARSYCRCAP